MTVLVSGARGSVGRGVLDALLTAGVPPTELRGAGRDPSVLALPEGVGAVALDFADPTTHDAALEGVDQVFCYAAEDLTAFADAARRAGVEHVALLSSLSVQEDGAESDGIARHHLEAERTLRGAGLTTTAVRPGAFDTNARQWAREIRADGVVTLPYPRATTAPIHEADIADVAAATLVDPAHRGTDLPLSGPESMSFAEQLDVLGREIGRDLAVREIDAATAREQMARHVPEPVVDSLFRLWENADGALTEVHDTVGRVTGRPARTFASWAREHRTEFTG